ncbi:hypothetical protein Mapa_007587 [Marchantia paleacea]|nr:hypothetical protein Mapa_007587 [Marchantia paleacea]
MGNPRTSSLACGPFTVSSTCAGNTISQERAVSSTVSSVRVSSAAASIVGRAKSGTNVGCTSADFLRGSSRSFLGSSDRLLFSRNKCIRLFSNWKTVVDGRSFHVLLVDLFGRSRYMSNDTGFHLLGN